jgi:C4-type Zn-finger protein
MTKFNEALLESMLEMIQKNYPNAKKVVAYEEVEKSTGYCDSCYYEYTEVYIQYLTEENTEPKTYNYSGDFGELIRELTNDG